MSDFASRITRSPHAFEAERGAEARALIGISGAIGDLIEGTAGCSPFLKGLIEKEAEWLRPVLADQTPEVAFNQVLAKIALIEGSKEMGEGLREAKRRVALLSALADLGGVWPLSKVTGALADLGDAAVQGAMRTLLNAEIARGKIPGAEPSDAQTGAGMFALAMGKMGAHELNYSSDIDLICLFDEGRYGAQDYLEARAAFIRVTRKMAAMLSDRTATGYVFRTDLRLRPDPSVTPVCISMDAAERYYESVGRTWERAAYIKARACAGDIAAGARFLTDMLPFVWRKHLDFAAIQDAYEMRLKIRDHKGLHGPIVLAGHDMKLGAGGIREIEFFTQTRQLIAGGRDPDLRGRETVPSLQALAAKDWISQGVADALSEDYVAHREVEHRLQMIRDAQTHDLPSSTQGMARLAAFMGQSEESLRIDLLDRLVRVDDLTEDFFAPSQALEAGGREVADVPLEDEAFTLSPANEEMIARWASYPALRSERAQEIFDRLRPELISRLSKVDNPGEALVHLDGFLAGLPAGVQLFSLFEANLQLVDLVVDICSTAPHLAQYLAHNSGVFDAVIGGNFFAPWPEEPRLQADLRGVLLALPDYEARLDGLRRWAKEWHFRIGVHQLRGLIDADEAGAQYADLAHVVLAEIWPYVLSDFERKHGAAPGRGAAVLGMGSLGAGRLNAASDLDLIMIYDAAGQEASEGRRPLASRAYYARLTQAFVTALSAPMAQGRLYEVDMRLRPSGRQGPVATSLQAFEVYQYQEAWTWEHLALTRARAVAGNSLLCQEVEALRYKILSAPKDGPMIRKDTADMRARLSEAKPLSDQWEAKQGPGRMMDIELFGQAAALLHGTAERGVYAQIQAGAASGWITADEGAALDAAYRLTWRLQAAARLLAGEKINLEQLGEGGRDFLLRATDAPSIIALAQKLATLCQAADRVISAALKRPFPQED